MVQNIIFFKSGMLCSCSSDSDIKFWDINTGKCIYTLEEHKGSVWSLSLTKNGDLVSAGDDRKVRFWKVSMIEKFINPDQLGGIEGEESKG